MLLNDYSKLRQKIPFSSFFKGYLDFNTQTIISGKEACDLEDAFLTQLGSMSIARILSKRLDSLRPNTIPTPLVMAVAEQKLITLFDSTVIHFIPTPHSLINFDTFTKESAVGNVYSIPNTIENPIYKFAYVLSEYVRSQLGSVKLTLNEKTIVGQAASAILDSDILGALIFQFLVTESYLSLLGRPKLNNLHDGSDLITI